MERCRGYKKCKGGLCYCGGRIWPWQKSIFHSKFIRGNSFSHYTHKDHITAREVMDELIKQPLLGEY